jgi:hypothetical protein
VVIGFAVLYTLITVLAFANAGEEPGQITPAVAGLLAVVAVLFWFGALLAGAGFYAAARVCLVVGGILAFPMGMVMVGAGRRIAHAGSALAAA